MHWAVKNRWDQTWKEEMRIASLPQRLMFKKTGLSL